jgi:hypothetical protein
MGAGMQLIGNGTLLLYSTTLYLNLTDYHLYLDDVVSSNRSHATVIL